MDLRGESSNIKIAALRRKWDFIYGELLETSELAGRQASDISVRRTGNNSGYSLNGCAICRITLLTVKTGLFTISLAEISSAYVVWINGEIARSSGTTSSIGNLGRRESD